MVTTADFFGGFVDFTVADDPVEMVDLDRFGEESPTNKNDELEMRDNK